jgi:hypothetical protein
MVAMSRAAAKIRFDHLKLCPEAELRTPYQTPSRLSLVGTLGAVLLYHSKSNSRHTIDKTDDEEKRNRPRRGKPSRLG